DIGNNCQIGVYPSPYFTTSNQYFESRFFSAKIRIGNNVYINNGCTIICEKTEINIGDGTVIGPGFVCFDSDFHSLNPIERNSGQHKAKKVNIGENVFIGINVTILKGVDIGDNCVIGAGLTITESIPKNSIVKGNRNEIMLISRR
ncbi:transferase, partial [Vibrio splendidus]|uniref:DapH/DapD/GlmU-related protein n=1 Tax=Vibrio splendidus TaxID=29497 RepID=UPI00148BEE47